MDRRSVKGHLIARDVEDVLRLVADRGISRAELEKHLDENALDLLETPINGASWYDVEIARQLVELLWEKMGDGTPGVLLDRGARNAEEMFNAGLYQQLDYLKRTKLRETTSPEERSRGWGRDLKLILTLSATCFNFTRWTVLPDPDHPLRHLVEVSDAADFPDVLCWCTIGYMDWMAVLHRGGCVWSWERVGSDLIRIRMTQDP